MKLYSLDLSPYAARVRGAIYAKNLPIEIVLPPDDWRGSDSFRRINPLGKVPVLILDDGTALPESEVIVEYLEDKFPEPSLRPALAEEAARMRLLIQVADLYVMRELMPIFNLVTAAIPDKAAIEEQFSKLDRGLVHLEHYLSTANKTGDRSLTMADVWLTPVRFSLGGLMMFTQRQHLLDSYPTIIGYEQVAKSKPPLSRIWKEMEEGLRRLMEELAKQRKNPPANSGA